jgi:hypothetical protein
MKESGITFWDQAIRIGGGKPILGGKRSLDQLRHLGHVGLAGQLRLEDGHQLAHVGRALGAGLRDGGSDGGGDFLAAHLFRQVGGEDFDLGLFDVGQILAIGGFVLGDAVLALLDQLFDDGGDGGVVEFDALIDFLLLDGGEQQADGDSRPASLAFMAVFMSSVMRALRSFFCGCGRLLAKAAFAEAKWS